MVSTVIFDLDGTLTTTPSPWRHVHERLGVWENNACGHLDDWLSGRIPYDEFCRRDTRLWNGCTVREIEDLLDEIDFNRHVPGIVRELVHRRIPSAIISSGFRYVARKVQQLCQWEPLLIYANELTEGPEVRINVSGDFVGPLSKRTLAGHALRHFNTSSESALVVSDTTRDLEALADCRYKLLVEAEDDLLKVHQYLES